MFIRQERSIREYISFYPIVSTIVIINFILWYLTDFSQTSLGHIILNFGLGSNMLVSEGEYWRLVTPIFLHSGIGHVLFNSFALVVFASPLEQILGRVKFLIFYLGAGIIGNIGTYLFGPEIYHHLGASGAVYGVFGIYLYMVFARQDLIDANDRQLILLLTLFGFVMTFIRPNINIYAHIFGYIGGLLLAPALLVKARPFSNWRNLQKRRSKHAEGDIQFDPNRWQKKGIPAQLKKNLIWIVLGILILFALFSRAY